MDEILDEESASSTESGYSVGNLLESKTSQLHDILQEKLEEAFHKQTSTVILHDIVKIASEHSPIDLAYAASRLPPHARPVLYENLSGIEGKIEFMVNTDNSTRVAVLRHISDEEVKLLVQSMPPDEAVEVLEAISERRFRRVVEMLEPKKAVKIREIKKHPRNTAGRLMTNEFFAFTMDVTIGEVAVHIRQHPGIDLTVKIFVLNDAGELQGYVPARNLIVNPPSLPLKQVMRPVVHMVAPDAVREEVVEIVERYKIPALPVVDGNHRMLGVITYEDVLDVAEDIADETIANMAGTAEKVSEQEPFIKRLIARAPWLVVTLCAGLINVGVMSSFQSYEGGILTFVLFFVPLITGMSGNIGIQCSTILVRSMALGLISLGNKGEMMFKELMIGLTTGTVFGILCGFAVYALDFVGVSGAAVSPIAVGVIVGVGLMGACLAGTVLGVFSPLFFARIGVDPAVASGPIITAFNDFLSMAIYFLIAIGLSAFLF
ncbi:MAG: magnesium transporter [Rhabdochlamydiaceae bacterium]|nr:magnesium transporter [Rhabdochlamydiaceae bacterium]